MFPKFKRMREKFYRVGGEERKINPWAKQSSNESCREHKVRASCTDIIINQSQGWGMVLEVGHMWAGT